MKIPSIAGVQNVIARKFPTVFGAWDLLDHDTGKAIVSFDSFVSFGYQKRNTVTQYPLEQGGFATYNKQTAPYETIVTLCKNGLNVSYQKQQFLSRLNEYADQPRLVDVLTPAAAYIGCTVSGAEYRQMSDQGADMLLVTLSIVQVREISEGNITIAQQVKNPDAADRVKQGLKALVGV